MSFRVNDRALKAGARCGRPHLHDNFCEELLRLAVVHGAGYSLRLEVKAHEDPDLSIISNRSLAIRPSMALSLFRSIEEITRFFTRFKSTGFPMS